MTEAPETRSNKDAITAVELARLLRRLARAFDSGDLGNVDTADALVALADYLQSLGSVAVSDLQAPVRSKRRIQSVDMEAVQRASVSEVRQMLDTGLPKARLVELARIRFGMPEARLRRLPTEQVVEAIEAAAAHEESLDIIERNAESSGRARSS